jgi:ketosteroid isomerase-like protein
MKNREVGMKRILISIFSLFFVNLSFAMSGAPQAPEQQVEQKNISIVKQMFAEVSEKRDLSKFDDFYARDFLLVSNNKNYGYSVYKKQQQDIFKKLESLKVLSYEDIFATKNKVVSRMSIKLNMKDGVTHTFYLIAIFRLKNDKIDRIWEITYPTWDDKLPTGQKS